MSGGDAVHFQPAHLEPISWGVTCPCCGVLIEIDDSAIRQDDFGAWCADGPEMFPECSSCGAFIEVKPVSVMEVTYG